MGLAEMPADFVNAYVLGSVGQTGHNMGACATFLYNLRHGMFDIESGRSRVALVGGAEAPLCPDVIEGLSTMGALGTDAALLELDRHVNRTEPDLRRACRPFASNCGFTIAEGAQFVVLLDDALALELGATIYGAVTDVLVHADGYKKSISSPGVGNYITVGKAVNRGRRIVVIPELPKLKTRVRFPSPAPLSRQAEATSAKSSQSNFRRSRGGPWV
jgi:acetoacetyl-[acyl-carrier protein] synthase